MAFFKRYGKIIYEGLDRPKALKEKEMRRRKSIGHVNRFNAPIETNRSSQRNEDLNVVKVVPTSWLPEIESEIPAESNSMNF